MLFRSGVITSTSGALESYGKAYVDGLNWGLKYYTGGKMTINGHAFCAVPAADLGFVEFLQ